MEVSYSGHIKTSFPLSHAQLASTDAFVALPHVTSQGYCIAVHPLPALPAVRGGDEGREKGSQNAGGGDYKWRRKEEEEEGNQGTSGLHSSSTVSCTKADSTVFYLGDEINSKVLGLKFNSIKSGREGGKEEGRMNIHPRLKLFSATKDSLLSWDIEQVMSEIFDHAKQPKPCLILNFRQSKGNKSISDDDLNYAGISGISLDVHDRLIGLLVGCSVCVVDIKRKNIDLTLEGHTAPVCGFEFAPLNANIAISISEDRTFKIWDIYRERVLYQSSITCAAPFISLSLDSLSGKFAIGSGDGVLRVYEYMNEHDCRLLNTLDVGIFARKERDKRLMSFRGASAGRGSKGSHEAGLGGHDKRGSVYIKAGESSLYASVLGSSTDAEVSSAAGGSNGGSASFADDTDCAINAISFVSFPTDIENGVEGGSCGGGDGLGWIQERPSVLMVATPSCILQVDCDSFDVLATVDYQEPIELSKHLDPAFLPQENFGSGSSDMDLVGSTVNKASSSCLYFIPIAGSYCFHTSISRGVTRCCVSSAFDKRVFVLDIAHPESFDALYSRLSNTNLRKGRALDSSGILNADISFVKPAMGNAVNREKENSLKQLLGDGDGGYISGPKSNERDRRRDGLLKNVKPAAVAKVKKRWETGHDGQIKNLEDGINTMMVIRDDGDNSADGLLNGKSEKEWENMYVDEDFESDEEDKLTYDLSVAVEDEVEASRETEPSSDLVYFLQTIAISHKWPNEVLERCKDVLIKKKGIGSVDDLRFVKVNEWGQLTEIPFVIRNTIISCLCNRQLLDSMRLASDGQHGPFLSILSTGPLLPSSPLRADIFLKPNVSKNTSSGSSSVTSKSRRKSFSMATQPQRNGGPNSPLSTSLSRNSKSLGNLPVTFKTKIRSSGYGQQKSPPRKMFAPKTNMSKSGGNRTKSLGNMVALAGKRRKSDDGTGTGTRNGILDMHNMNKYPVDCGPLTRLQCKYKICDSTVRNVGVNCVEFSNDGRYIAESSTDKTCRSIKLPNLVVPPTLMGKSYAQTGNNPNGIKCLYANKIDIPLSVKSRMKPSEASYTYLCGLPGMDYVGHDAHIEKIHWSQDGQYLLSCSMDHTVRVWNNNKPDTLFTIRHPISNMRGKEQGSMLKNSESALKPHILEQPPPMVRRGSGIKTGGTGGTGDGQNMLTFAHPIKEARFFYLDKFILLASGSRLLLYKYFIDPSAPDDLKRYQSNNCYKQVVVLKSDSIGVSETSSSSFSHTLFPSASSATGRAPVVGMYGHNPQQQQSEWTGLGSPSSSQPSVMCPQSITAFDCNNGFHSQLVLTAGSNRSIEIYDMNAGRVARRIMDAHTRPIHTLRIQKGSAHVSHPSQLYDLFLTQSHQDGIKLWDLRSNRCVRKYQGHYNKTHTVGMAFSPCARYIATGSENKCAYLYDIRQGTYLHKLEGHGDVVTDVNFHPVSPILATSCLDGNVTFFDDIH
eukprot:Nk52_evm8s1524 gene=Nk52_evmTU8s1524